MRHASIGFLISVLFLINSGSLLAQGTSYAQSVDPDPTTSDLFKSIAKKNATAAQDFFLGLRHPFWNLHYTLTSEIAPKEMAIIGDSRIAEILANVLLPFFLAEGRDIWSAYEKLPARLTNRRLETGATRLFGSDPRRPHFTKTIAQQQGLLQIYEDFCLQDNSDCAQCPFPEQMQKWK